MELKDLTNCICLFIDFSIEDQGEVGKFDESI